MRINILIALMATTLVLSTALPPADAFRLSVGTVQAEKRMEPAKPDSEDVNESTYDLTESAAVVSMIKLLAHYLPQQVYFMNSDPSPNYPSVSIISILIKLAASSKMSDRPLMAKKEKSELNLAPPVINTDGTVNQVKSKGKPDKKAAKLAIGQKTPALNELDPESAVQKEAERKTRSIAGESLYDSKNLETKSNKEETAEHNKLKTANLYSDFLSPSVRLNPPKENMQFLFWTCPPATNEQASVKEIAADNKFEGSFVVSQHGTRFKSVHGRQFTLEEGKLLSCNRQAELSFQTPLANIVLPPGSAALISLDKNILSIQAIEGTGKSTVTAIVQGKKLYLAMGQQLDINAQGKPTTSKFSISQLMQKERLIDGHAAYLNQQQASAIAELLKRITASTTATSDGSQ
ncbi:MAG: hypothetical protein K2X29_11610 [Candidatus Obscuribacterales bacterium]|nr:hypothetical protein [Candidatus Obscuribacterales bacterium]